MRIDDTLHLLDLNFQGQPGVIGSYLLDEGSERALIEIGPGSSLANLLEALQKLDVDPGSITKVLLTHIHLDHAGAAGAFLRRFPQAQLLVHEVGVPHLLDPSKLLASAQRIWGEKTHRLWGDFEPVGPKRIVALQHGNEIRIGGHKLTALYTPGHASHHIAYLDAARSAVFTGDVAGVRLDGRDYVRPPTPPPDLDLQLWDESVALIRQHDPKTLFLTHFGPFLDVDEHLTQVQSRLHAWARMVDHKSAAGSERDDIVAHLTAAGDSELRSADADQVTIDKYELATPYFMTVDGYLRYFRKRAPSLDQAPRPQ